MKQFTIQVKDDKAGFFIELMRNFSFVRIKEMTDDGTTPEDQKDFTDQRVKDYLRNPAVFQEFNDVPKDLDQEASELAR